ncbi:MAG TPA: hypothetical protein VMX74_05785 [Pirellulales bacterium]|nr:hypothetical protein [Pirellulales bacterium]
MSYDVHMEALLGGTAPVALRLLDEHYTSNVSPMFVDVLGHSISEWDGIRASVVADECSAILAAFHASPGKYRSKNPTNCWGNFDGAKEFIQKIHDACTMAPDATVRVV